jgi:K+-sensing histidine kinase KdpD
MILAMHSKVSSAPVSGLGLPVVNRLMLALSSQSPRSRPLLEEGLRLAKNLGAEWFVVHVREAPELHYRGAATEHPIPHDDLQYARNLGARVLIERGEVVETLVSLARKMSINYFVAGRSIPSWLVFRWKLPLADAIQRELPTARLIIV